MVRGVPSELAPTLKKLREEAGASQGQLVKRATAYGGISSGLIGGIETGERGLSTDKAEVIALALGLSDEQFRELLAAAGHDPDRVSVAARDLLTRLDGLEERFDRLERLVQREIRRRRGAR